MKKMMLFSTIAILILSIVLAACQPQAATQEEIVTEETEQEAEVREIFIAFEVDNLDEATNTHTEAAKACIEEVNAERDDIHITYQVTDAQNNVENQISSMESWILKGADLILFTYVDVEAAKPLVKAARDEGILIVDIRNLEDEDLVDLVYYGNDEPTFATMMTSWLESYLQDNPEVVLNTGLIYGLATQFPQLIRIDLVKDLAEKYPDQINILVEANGDWDPAKAQAITEDWLQAFPDMNYIHVGNTGMATGVTTALEGAGKTDDFLVAANDLSDSAIQMLYDGQMDVVTGALFSDFGCGYIEAAVALLDGEVTEKAWNKVIPYAVDASNLEDFLANKWDGKQPE